MVFNVKMAIILFENMPGAMVLGVQSSGQCCFNKAGFIDNTFMIIFDHTSIIYNDDLGSFQQSSLMTTASFSCHYIAFWFVTIMMILMIISAMAGCYGLWWVKWGGRKRRLGLLVLARLHNMQSFHHHHHQRHYRKYHHNPPHHEHHKM